MIISSWRLGTLARPVREETSLTVTDSDFNSRRALIAAGSPAGVNNRPSCPGVFLRHDTYITLDVPW